MSINQLFEITRRSFRSFDAGMNTVAQNVANAETEGYARRRVSFQAEANTSPGLIMRTPYGTATGAGVTIGSYDRMRDILLQAATSEARTALGSAQEEQRLLGALEEAFPVGEGSLNAVLSDFWDAWSNLADNPTDVGVRVALRGKATGLLDTMHRAAEDLTTLQGEAEGSLAAHVDEVNGLLDEIAALNEVAGAARMNGSPDLAAEDRRDQLVQDLAAFAPIRFTQDGERGYKVTMNGMTVVQGNAAMGLELDTSGTPPRVFYKDTQVEYNAPAGNDGKLGAALRTVQETLPDTRTALDELAATLVAEVNTLHSGGYGLDGGTGRAFFDAAGLTAGSIRLSGDVLADVRAVAASGDATALGDSSVALTIADLRSQPLLGGGIETPGAFATNLLTDIGSRVDQASTNAHARAAVVDHLAAMEQGVSGVSLDEEMTNLIQYQQAFTAAARVLDTAQEMLDTLLAM